MTTFPSLQQGNIEDLPLFHRAIFIGKFNFIDEPYVNYMVSPRSVSDRKYKAAKERLVAWLLAEQQLVSQHLLDYRHYQVNRLRTRDSLISRMKFIRLHSRLARGPLKKRPYRWLEMLVFPVGIRLFGRVHYYSNYFAWPENRWFQRAQYVREWIRGMRRKLCNKDGSRR